MSNLKKDLELIHGKEKTRDLIKSLAELKKINRISSVNPSKEQRTMIKGVIPVLSDKQKVIGGQEFTEKIAKKLGRTDALKRIASAGKRGLKALPLVGGIAAGLASQDVSAAVPILGEAEPLGPQPGDEGYLIENPWMRKKLKGGE